MGTRLLFYPKTGKYGGYGTLLQKSTKTGFLLKKKAGFGFRKEKCKDFAAQQSFPARAATIAVNPTCWGR